MPTADDSPPERTRPSEPTRAAEREEAQTPAHADRTPTADEERLADGLELDPDVADHAQEMAQRGADQKGEGRVP